jgi:hypothetical protein
MSQVELGSLSGPEKQPEPPQREKRKWTRGIGSILSALGVRRSESSGRVVEVQNPAALHAAEASSPSAINADLSDVALKMSKSGASLTEHRGRLEVKGRFRLISYLPKVSERSPENARNFLKYLASPVGDDPAGAEMQVRVRALHNFATSKWFQKVLRQDPNLIAEFIFTAEQVVKNAKEKTSLPGFVESKVRDLDTTLNTLKEIMDAVNENGGTQQEAAELVCKWMLGKLGVGKKTYEYTSSKIEQRRYANVRKTLHITAEGRVMIYPRFDPRVDTDDGRACFLDQFPTKDLFQRLSQKGTMRELPPELGNDRMGTYFYQVQQVGGSSQDKRQAPRLVGEPSSGTIGEYFSSHGVTTKEKLQATLGVLQGLRFLHFRGYTHAVGLKDIEVVGGRGKLAEGPFVSEHSLVFKEAYAGASGLAPELLEEGYWLRMSSDMFALGAMLLTTIDPEGLGKDLKELGLKAYKGEISPEDYKAEIKKIQDTLKAKAGEGKTPLEQLYGLIANLINPNDLGRLDSTTTEQRLQSIVQSWPKEKAE